MKRRVLRFFGILLFLTLALLLVQTARFGSPTGVTVANVPSNLALKITSAFQEGNTAAIGYSIMAPTSSGKMLAVAYTLRDDHGGVVKTGELDIVHSSGTSDYTLRLLAPEASNVVLSVSDGTELAYDEEPIRTGGAPIGGAVIGARNVAFSYAIFACILIFIVGYTVRHFYHRHSLHALSSRVDGRFIHIN